MKLRINVYEFLRWELVHSFVFILEKMRIWSKSATVILVMSVCPLAFAHDIVREVTEVVIRFPVLKHKCAQDGIFWTFDSQYDRLVFIFVFDTNKASINIMYNIQG